MSSFSSPFSFINSSLWFTLLPLKGSLVSNLSFMSSCRTGEDFKVWMSSCRSGEDFKQARWRIPALPPPISENQHEYFHHFSLCYELFRGIELHLGSNDNPRKAPLWILYNSPRVRDFCNIWTPVIIISFGGISDQQRTELRCVAVNDVFPRSFDGAVISLDVSRNSCAHVYILCVRWN